MIESVGHDVNKLGYLGMRIQLVVYFNGARGGGEPQSTKQRRGLLRDFDIRPLML